MDRLQDLSAMSSRSLLSAIFLDLASAFLEYEKSSPEPLLLLQRDVDFAFSFMALGRETGNRRPLYPTPTIRPRLYAVRLHQCARDSFQRFHYHFKQASRSTMLSARVAISLAIVAVLSTMTTVNAAPAAIYPNAEAVTSDPDPPGYAFCTTRPDFMSCYNLCGPGGYWFIKPKCCCP
ncbi:hypothetical protein B0O80DRAFT_531258 [Mortierella sp. GBAus27b]|nr:hypothetical protein B0O80DRAFT_531258 [Mortierella sp. GBAus27b]